MPTVTPEQCDFEEDESQYLLCDSYDGCRAKRPKGKVWGFFCFCCSFFGRLLSMGCCCCPRKTVSARSIKIGAPITEKYPPNVIRNQKYNIFTFIPLVLYEQFKFFLNLYFLFLSLSQFIPELKVGYLYTYWGPLAFVLLVTMIREGIDDIRRKKRDQEINRQEYLKLTTLDGLKVIKSSSIQVGDIIIVEKDHRVPADLLFLRTSEAGGASFIRTDQLDGETDWKLKLAVPETQKLETDADIFSLDATVFAERPQKDIHSFIGTFKMHDTGIEESLSVENAIWANTVVASGRLVGLVLYTGSETRSAMNNTAPSAKVGLLDLEVNNLTKLLFAVVVSLAVVMICLKGFGGAWYNYLFRYIILFSYIIPLSLRVNLDLGKVFFSWYIMQDKDIKGTVVRSTTIPEELGRISYLLTDKTGTLTQNEMVFRQLHLGQSSYGIETFDDVKVQLQNYFKIKHKPSPSHLPPGVKRTLAQKIGDAVKALALCHNVTPVFNSDTDDEVNYQAASPDEVALVRWTEQVGLPLVKRDLETLTLRTPDGQNLVYTILKVFPFTSENKRMGIIVQDNTSGEICMYMKGADTVMGSLVEYNDWLEEETATMAKRGLRTLVVGKKVLTEEQYANFDKRYHAAKLSMVDRASKVTSVIESIECDLQLLCITGVEDKLQTNVKQTLELLKNAGMKIWMLTGDKLETATCIAKSSRLVSPNQTIHIIGNITSRQEAHAEINVLRRRTESALIIKGDSLDTCLQYYELELMDLIVQCPSVVVCRCSPTQKASVITLIQRHTKLRCAAVGDGGNDVSMIQAANAGIGIEGKEGRQASLAADFSVTQFQNIGRLFLVHGRYSYKRSAALAQFVMHRGFIITTIQAVFSAIFYFASITLYQGFLMVGYATIYTNFPVFSLVLDRDISPKIALAYPELYKDLIKGRSLSYKTFLTWVLISTYQGSVLMFGALLLFGSDLIHVVTISFTALILTELIMVGLTIRTWHPLMVVAILLSIIFYALSILFMEQIEWSYILTKEFLWKVVCITLVSCLPLYIIKFLSRKFTPPTYSKLEELNTFESSAFSTRTANTNQ